MPECQADIRVLPNKKWQGLPRNHWPGLLRNHWPGLLRNRWQGLDRNSGRVYVGILISRHNIIDDNRYIRWQGVLNHCRRLIYLQPVMKMALTDLIPGTEIRFGEPAI